MSTPTDAQRPQRTRRTRNAALPRDVGDAMATVVGLVLQLLASLLGVVWIRHVPRSPPRRLRHARSSVRELATSIGDHDRRTVATLGPRHGHAKVTLDGESERLVIECPWEGIGPILPRQLPWDRLPPLFSPLRCLRGIDTVASSPRTLTVSGDLSAADRLRETLHAVTSVASRGRRLRENLEQRGLREGWSVALTLDGPRVVLRRTLACRPRTSDSEHVAALLPGVTRVEVGEESVAIAWARAPTQNEIEAVDAGLRALARDVYR